MSHWLAERLAYLGRSLSVDVVWRRKASRIPPSSQIPKLKVDISRRAKHRLSANAVGSFVTFSGFSDLSRPRKELYRELVVGSASDPLSNWRGWTAEEVRSHWNWAPGSGFLNNSEFSLNWRLAQNALPVLGLNLRAGLADMSNCARCYSGLEETAEHTFYYCERVRPFWSRGMDGSHRIQAARAVRHWLRCKQRSVSVSGWEACGVSHDPSCCQNGDLDDAKEGIVWQCKLF